MTVFRFVGRALRLAMKWMDDVPGSWSPANPSTTMVLATGAVALQFLWQYEGGEFGAMARVFENENENEEEEEEDFTGRGWTRPR